MEHNAALDAELEGALDRPTEDPVTAGPIPLEDWEPTEDRPADEADADDHEPAGAPEHEPVEPAFHEATGDYIPEDVLAAAEPENRGLGRWLVAAAIVLGVVAAILGWRYVDQDGSFRAQAASTDAGQTAITTAPDPVEPVRSPRGPRANGATSQNGADAATGAPAGASGDETAAARGVDDTSTYPAEVGRRSDRGPQRGRPREWTTTWRITPPILRPLTDPAERPGPLSAATGSRGPVRSRCP